MLAHIIKKALLFGSSHQTWIVELIGDNLLMVWKRDRGRTEGRWWKHLPGSVQGVAGSRRKQRWMNNGTDCRAERLPPAQISGFCSWSPQVLRTSEELLPVCFICDWGYFLQWLASLLFVFKFTDKTKVEKFGFSWRHFPQTTNLGILSSLTSLKILSRVFYAESQGSLLKNRWSTQTKCSKDRYLDFW